MAFTAQERLESLKAGGIGALALGAGFALLLGLHGLIRRSPYGPSVETLLPTYESVLLLGVSGAIALMSGLLFGVTYRYIIRTDTNPQLKAGAVGAFGLIRGLTQVDTGLLLQGSLETLVLIAAESLLLFAIAQLSLDSALQQKWIRPFGSGEGSQG